MSISTTKNIWIYIITGVLMTANIVTLTLLWTHNGGNKDDKHQHRPQGSGPQLFDYISRELNLDSAQKKAYALLRDEHRSGVEKLQDSIRDAKDELFTMLRQSNVTDAAITAQSNKAAALNAQLDVFTFHHFQKVRALCNADQQKRFDEIIQEALHSMAQPQGPPPGPGGGRPGMPPPPEHP